MSSIFSSTFADVFATAALRVSISWFAKSKESLTLFSSSLSPHISSLRVLISLQVKSSSSSFALIASRRCGVECSSSKCSVSLSVRDSLSLNLLRPSQKWDFSKTSLTSSLLVTQTLPYGMEIIRNYTFPSKAWFSNMKVVAVHRVLVTMCKIKVHWWKLFTCKVVYILWLSFYPSFFTKIKIWGAGST